VPAPGRNVEVVSLLFVEFWQHECCGDLFGVGDVVAWPVVPVEGDGLVSLLGADLGRQLPLTVDRHGDDHETLTGTVLSIRAVFHQLEPVTGQADGVSHRARPGSAQLRYVNRTQRRERLGDLEWAGYMVELSVSTRSQPDGPA